MPDREEGPRRDPTERERRGFDAERRDDEERERLRLLGRWGPWPARST